MENEELYDSINRIMVREMQDMGTFILKKQCQDLGISRETIKPQDLPELASNLSRALSTFCGKEKAREIFQEVKKFGDISSVIEKEKNILKKAEHLENMGNAALVTGDWNDAEQYFRKMLSESRKKDNAKIEVSALLNLGYLMKEKGDIDKGVENYNQALDKANKNHFYDALTEALQGLGYIHWRRGDFASAQIVLEKALGMAKEHELEGLKASILIDTGSNYASMGDIDECLESYHEAIKILEKLEDKRELSRVENNLGDVYLVQGKPKKALLHFDIAKSLAQESEDQNMVAWTLFNGAEALVMLNDLPEVKNRLEEAEVLLNAMGDEVGLSAVSRVWGMFYTKAGKYGKAQSELEKAKNKAIKMGMPWDIAEVEYRTGLMYLAMGDLDNAKYHIKRAIETYQDLGANLEMDRAEKKLEEVENLA